METQENQTTETAAPSPQDSGMSFKDAAESAFEEMEAASSDDAAPETDTREAAPAAKEEPKEDSPFTWDTIDPRAKKEFEAIDKRFKGLQSYVTKQQQQWKMNEERLSKFEELEGIKQKFDQFSRLYDTNPEMQAAINRALGVKGNEVDESLAQDPLYQYMTQREQAQMQLLKQQEEKLAPIMQWFETQQKEKAEAEINSRVEAVEKSAMTTFAKHMGREPSQEETAKIIKHMVDNSIYDGEAAAIAVFFNDIVAKQKQAAMEDQMKKKAVGTRVTQTTAKGSSDKYSKMSIKDIFRETMDEQGF